MNSKLELRIEAARLAVENGSTDFTEKAKEIYSFIEGNTDLPEVYNPNEAIEKCMNRLSEFSKIDNNVVYEKNKELSDKEEEGETIADC